jgi:lipopolysaccharide assembly outer membrane protein LptD (OstA)
MTEQVRRPNGTACTAYDIRSISSTADFNGGNNGFSTLAQPHIIFHTCSGAPRTMIADAPKAKLTLQDKSVLMTGGVHARSQDGGVLTCDQLQYDGRTQRLHGAGHVVLTGPNGYRLNGEYLDGDVRMDHVTVTGTSR